MSNSTFHTDFNLSIKEYVADCHPLHRHNYFELIYVLEGRGIHVINENQFAYGKGDLFLLTPADKHTFQAHTQSMFCIIDFTASFFGRTSPVGYNKPELSGFFKQLEYIFQNAHHYKGFVAMNEEDNLFSGALVRRLITEWDKEVFSRDIILQNLVFLLLNIIARYVHTTLPTSSHRDISNSAYEIINYIQQNIYENDKISVEKIAEHFHFSKDYMGAYFRKQTGSSIRQFILGYKLELAKSRLQYSKLTVSQIAAELGFTDESHLNKVFHKNTGMTAKQYQRKKIQK